MGTKAKAKFVVAIDVGVHCGLNEMHGLNWKKLS